MMMDKCVVHFFRAFRACLNHILWLGTRSDLAHLNGRGLALSYIVYCPSKKVLHVPRGTFQTNRRTTVARAKYYFSGRCPVTNGWIVTLFDGNYIEVEKALI